MSTQPITTGEAARRLNVSVNTVRRMVEDGRLTGDAHPITNRLEIDPRSVHRMLTEAGMDER